MSMSDDPFDIDFSLALHNRTGKYFIGRDIIDKNKANIEKIRYWRVSAEHLPTGWRAKAIGKLLSVEESIRRFKPVQNIWLARPQNRVVHLDPFTVVYTRLQRHDVVLCHDLGPITHPELFDPAVVRLYRRAYDIIARAAPTLVFVSRSSLLAYCGYYGAVENMRVIFPPIRAEFAEASQSEMTGIKPPYFLTVGSIGRRKNQLRAIEAFAASGLAHQGWSYVLCGSREPGSVDVIAKADATAGVSILPYVSDDQRNWLYANMAAFVLPSLLEGFGIPVAEAIAYGAIPIISNESVLEEVAGEGALSVDPLDIDAIRDAMIKLSEITDGERSRRQRLLREAIGRFTTENFDSAWSELFSQLSNQTER